MTANARGPEICKWNLSDIEAEIGIVSLPADCIRQQPHFHSAAAAVPRTTTVQLSQSPPQPRLPRLPRLPTMSSWMKPAMGEQSRQRAAKLKLYAEIVERRHQILEGGLGRHRFDLTRRATQMVECVARQAAREDPREESKVQAKIVELNKLKAPKELVVAIRLYCCPDRRGAAAHLIHGRARAAHAPGQQIAVVLPDGKTVAVPATATGHRVPHPIGRLSFLLALIPCACPSVWRARPRPAGRPDYDVDDDDDDGGASSLPAVSWRFIFEVHHRPRPGLQLLEATHVGRTSAELQLPHLAWVSSISTFSFILEGVHLRRPDRNMSLTLCRLGRSARAMYWSFMDRLR